MTTYRHYYIQLADLRDGSIIQTAGGRVQACAVGTGSKVAIYDQDGQQLNAVSPSIALNRGMIDFWVLDGIAAVDLYGIAPNGHAFAMNNVGPSGPNALYVDQQRRDQVLLLPWSSADSVAATEKDTGFDLPAGALVGANVAVNVLTAQATKTVDAGILSTEPGGAANGFLAAIPIGVQGPVLAKSAATATRGALIGGGTLDRGYAVAAGAQSLSYTTSAGTSAANGLLVYPYTLPIGF